jgi:hypothetical protein
MVKCNHSTLTVVHCVAEEEKGSVQLEICANRDCAKIVNTICEHINNEWRYTRNLEDPEEQVLICKLCGADGT